MTDTSHTPDPVVVLPTHNALAELTSKLSALEHYDYDVHELNLHAVAYAQRCEFARLNDDSHECQELLNEFSSHFTGVLSKGTAEADAISDAYRGYVEQVWQLFYRAKISESFPPEHYNWEYHRELTGDIVTQFTLEHP